ncbi:hypothetical protein MMC10_007554 [Thelotrema lepadinum]|nr:hypothetical protein [Thelotrema lepadinum]
MVEAQTGHMTFADYFLTDTLQRQTWTDLNIEVSKASHFVYDIEYATSCLSIYCDTTLSLIENLESDSRFSSSAHRVRHSSIKLKENLSITKLGIRTLHHNLNYLKARCEIQQRTLFNLITREDASVNIRIAEDSRLLARASKRDSVAMKTMSVVTMAFLPGTFVAALFAMPLFDWSSAEGEAILSNRFWIYWVVTVPLTVVVISTWWFWKNWRERKDFSNDQAALQEGPESRNEEVVSPSRNSEGIAHFAAKLRRRTRLQARPQSVELQSIDSRYAGSQFVSSRSVVGSQPAGPQPVRIQTVAYSGD